ncbi:chemotaxis protein CheX [candidate division KSB1 bacterium]|nr:chemotaxis protein CheX [candidate division KSB1 bacterium]
MEPDLRQNLETVAERVFDAAAFLAAYPTADREPAPVDRVGATITFRGPRCGRLALYVERQMLDTLALNMLGEPDDEDPEARRGDALKEILNMICGNLLTVCYGEAAVFNLSPPELLDESNAPASEPDAQAVRVLLNLEETLAELTITEHAASNPGDPS